MKKISPLFITVFFVGSLSAHSGDWQDFTPSYKYYSREISEDFIRCDTPTCTLYGPSYPSREYKFYFSALNVDLLEVPYIDDYGVERVGHINITGSNMAPYVGKWIWITEAFASWLSPRYYGTYYKYWQPPDDPVPCSDGFGGSDPCCGNPLCNELPSDSGCGLGLEQEGASAGG